jgi:arylsulfatase A-like enzyme
MTVCMEPAAAPPRCLGVKHRLTARAACAALGLALVSGCTDERLVGQDYHAECFRPGCPPNVILFVADDMGWRDCAAYGSEFYETPHIDRLVRHGMRFTSAYAAAPLCSPTRASILTGQYPARLGLTTAVGHELNPRLEPYLPDSAPPTSPRIEPVSSNRLRHQQVTLAEVLQAAGYATAHFGKWHLGWGPYEPTEHGFDDAAPGGSYAGPPSYFSPYRIATFSDGPPGEHIDERLAKEAVAFMARHQYDPFFLNFWAFSVHAPFQGKPELVDKYRARADSTDPQHSPTMGAMLETMDRALGRLIDAVDELGLADNTIIVVFSDNGGNMYDVVDATTPTSNHPLRGGKGTIYEGGLRVPLVVVWPDVIPAGLVSDALVSSVDLYPTLLDLAGVQANPAFAPDAKSFGPVLRQQAHSVRNEIACHFPHSIEATRNVAATSIRQDEWKLIRFYADGPGQNDRYELYHLPSDPGEAADLAAAQPDRVAQLDGLIDQHLRDTSALVPIANPAYVPPTGP